MKGPKFNKKIGKLTGRDPLGIESVANSMGADLCPIINTVSPRAFYWPFLVWIYYDFHKNLNPKEKSYKSFDYYLKKQDYYFVLSNLLIEGSDQTMMVGKDKTFIDIENKPDGPFECNREYFITKFGGMQYYNAGIFSMNLLVDTNPETGDRFSFPKLTKEGEEMALAFENVIKDTEYYKNYRLTEEVVPKSVLLEYGEIVNLKMKKFSECKTLLEKYFFEKKQNYKLVENKKYLEYLFYDLGIKELGNDNVRNVLFDYFSVRGDKKELPIELKPIADSWEIVVGRQYMVVGIEMIWRNMLKNLNKRETKETWIEGCLYKNNFQFSLSDNLEGIIADSNFNYDEREELIRDIKSKRVDVKNEIEIGLRILMSLYNRFVNREDISESNKKLFEYGNDRGAISISKLFELVDDYKEKPIQEFLKFIMEKWVIDQHYNTAYNKLLEGRDGFFFEVDNGIYYRKNEGYINFTGIRLIQMMQVLKDLEILREN